MNRMLAAAGVAALLGLGASAAHATTVNLGSDQLGGLPQGFSVTGHPELTFKSALGGGGDLYGYQGFESDADGSLVVFDDFDGNYLLGTFHDGTHTQISMDFGNDDPCCTIPSDLATLRVYLGATLVGQTTMSLNRDDQMNQTIAFSGGPFDNFSFAYTNAAGAPFTGTPFFGTGLIEVVDHWTFDAPGGAPEPASWAMMLTGFLGLGGALRARRRAVTAA